MSIVHDQAMHYIYQQVLERLLSHMSQAQRASLQLLIQRLLVAAGGPEYIGTFRLLVMQGGDRRSARLLAILRAAQLSIALRAPVTFQLRVVVVCVPGVSSALIEHHEQSFNALFMHDDVRVQLQTLEAGVITPFSRPAAVAAEHWNLSRDAMLLFGHLVDARPEAVLGSRVQLELAAALRLALEGQPWADALVTAMPLRQRRRYLAWARRGLRLAGEAGSATLHHCMATLADRLGQLHAVAGSPLDEPGTLGCEPLAQVPLRVIALDDLLPQLLGDGELDQMMGCFEPSRETLPLAALLDPLALAQLHELRAQCSKQATPRQTLHLVCHKGVSMQHSPQQVRFANAYGINPIQLTCMLHSPFADQGKGLERFLQCCHRDMLVALPYLHRALQGKPCPEAVKDWLVSTSGLTLVQLRAIYAGRLHRSARRLLANLARRDVHLAWLAPAPETGALACKGHADGA
ncbi:hypothetical protein MXF29_21405 [Pseudomonas sp. NC26]|uniref:Uncharacterized protein n=1 Tax=Pseudomonas putida TaxID=303 RepID=A0A7W2QHZ6_PSEPU|nr:MULTISPECIES: hypothetical protein [Pseudomonas]MBA6115257.1 hypothetical protein [Pseudomonas putida]MCZ9639440.1 hypothetical protein [Pseudomonas putida]MEC4878157.1 hypothetical protein [Pseudomonas sp. NC26]QNL88494.1 Uncharacterized protein PPKH_3080 [Pseudomonas putida]